MCASRPSVGLDELVGRLSAGFGALGTDGLDAQVEETLGEIGGCLHLDLCILWQPAFGLSGLYGLTHVWQSPSLPAPPDPLWLHAHLPWCASELREERPLVLPSLGALPDGTGRDRAGLEALGVRGALGLPVRLRGGPVEAIFTFHSRTDERPWPPAEIRNLELVAQAVANALARRRAEQALRARDQRLARATGLAAEMKHAVAARIESETRLAAAVNVAGLGFYELQGGGRVTYFDARLRALLGLSREQATHAPEIWQENVHPADRARVSRLMLEAMEGRRESVATEYRYRHPRRGTVWLHHLFRVLERDGERRGTKAIGAIQDVTARRRALLALARSERSFRATFEQAPVGVAHVGLDGALLWVNGAFHEFLGLTRQALQTSNFLELAHQAQLPTDAGQVRQMLAGEIDTTSSERRYLRSSGEVVWGHVTVSLVRDRRGKPDWFVIIVQDVTARRRAEEELNRLHGQLWHADRAAQVGVLSASLAHELNQPLSAILTNAQAALRFLAMEKPDLEEIRTILQDIVQDDKRAGMVVSGLRAMLRRRGTQRESVRLADALHEVLGLLRTELLDRRVRVSTESDPDLVVSADRTQLQQVMLNLLMNAIEAVHDRPPEDRHIELTIRPVGRAQAQLAVRDHGPGISPEQQERMFEAFWTTKESGMGIGLAISRSIVETHGGQLWYRNNPDGGATFHFTLPLQT
ncbi:MAG TPA: PAS domain S-box protein [Candidatus Polarisedimenticolaceae bacterium]|nr:PAS domain S-box protein [Candidatus Polarisedimenticolaceae bacterium]